MPKNPHTQRLPGLSPETFAELCRELAGALAGRPVVTGRKLPRGVDALIESAPGAFTAYRFRWKEPPTERTLRGHVNEFLRTPLAKQSGTALFFCVPTRLISPRVVDAISAEASRLAKKKVEFDVWDAERLGTYLAGRPELAKKYLSGPSNRGTGRSAADPDDPHKGRFGGKEVDGGLRLSATVKKLDSRWSEVRVIVHPIDPWAPPPKGSVTFHLHPSFAESVERVAFDKRGRAINKLVSYGAFTVGVETSSGVRLELDLSTLEAPTSFRRS